MDRNSCLNYFQAFPFWEHMTEEDQDFLLDNITRLSIRNTTLQLVIHASPTNNTPLIAVSF